jgi:peptidoglycan/LPS O-acetylase OafA/YrhL
MTRRLEAGPLLVTLGALLLLVSLFLSWFDGEITAWEAFEVWDLGLFVLALGAIAAGMGLIRQDVELVDRRLLPAGVVAVAVIVASQILDPPPAAAGLDPDTGAWLALGGALVMCAGAVLTFGRVHFALTVEERTPRRRRVAAVDARGPADPTTDNIPAVTPPERESRRLFARDRSEEKPAAGVTQEAPAGNDTAEQKQD